MTLMVFAFSRNAACLLAVAVATFGCSGTERSGDEETQSTAQGVTAPWGASYVNQSFPLATTTLKMKAGSILPSYITLKNSGSNTWDSNTRIGTTEPRDRVSAFADSTWVNPSRPSAVTGTVAPGSTFKFTFDLKAPTKLGTYDEFFGVVQEGVVWFGDSGQGGPVDNDLEVKIEVIAADPVADAGPPAEDDAGDTDSGGPISVGQIPTGSDGGDGEHDPASTDPSDDSSSGGKSGCSISARGSRNSHFNDRSAIAFVALGFAFVLRRRRR